MPDLNEIVYALIYGALVMLGAGLAKSARIISGGIALPFLIISYTLLVNQGNMLGVGTLIIGVGFAYAAVAK